MKKVFKPSQKEEAVYYSDFTGKCFGNLESEVTVTLSFNYGSKYDGAVLKLDLADKEAEEILTFFKSRLTEDTKKEFQKRLNKHKTHLEDSIQARDYSQCEYSINCTDVLKFLVN